MLIVAASTKFALASLIVAVLPTFVLLSCCFGKKKRKSKMASISLKINMDADKKRKKQAAPTINNPYVSKTTNKVSGLGPDDPDLDSKRLKNGDDKPATTKNKKEAGKPVVVAGPAGGVDVPPSPAGSVSLLSGKTQPSSTIKTAKSGRLNLGNKFNWAEQKRGNHPLGIPHFAAEEERHKESPHCIVAAAGHLENQQSIPRLFPKDSRHSHESYRIAGAKQPSESESTIRHEVNKAG